MTWAPWPLVSVVLATYEWPAALDAQLRALAEDADAATEVVVADDGSGSATRDVIEAWRGRGLRVEHAWQPDEGWRKTRVLNLAALAARGELLLFLDGDVLPRRGFLRAVRRAARPGWFLASKRLLLPPELTRSVLERGLPVWRWSALGWVLRRPRALVARGRYPGRPGVLFPLRDRRRPWRPHLADFVPPYDAYGYFTGVWREDFERVNGFDQRFEGWGGEDEDLAARLRHAGLRCGWPGPRATLLHLHHEPRKGLHRSNQPLVQETKAAGRVEALVGLRELRAELAV